MSDYVFRHKGLATKLNALPEVAEHFERRLRAMTATGQWVIDRGARLYRDAPLNFWLTASAEARAARRCGQLAAQGEYVSFGRILREQRERSASDQRLFRPAEGVHAIDTTHSDAESIYSHIAHIIMHA